MENYLEGKIAADLADNDVAPEALGGVVAELLLLDEAMVRIFSELPLRLLLVDMQGEIVAATPSALDSVLGLERDEVVGRNFTAVLDRCGVELAQAIEAGAAVLAGEPWEGSFGKAWRLRVNSLGDLSALGGLRMLIFEAECSRESRIREAARLEKMERLMKVGQVAYTSMHEMKNLLQNISGYAQLMQLKHAEEPGVSEFTRFICDEVAVMSGVVLDCLGMTNIDMKVSRHSLNDVVREALMRCYGSCHVNKIEVSEELCPEMPEIAMDKQRIKQVFFNFIDNSVQAIIERRKNEPELTGQVKISTGYQPADGDEAEQVYVIFEDDGVGMDREALDNFFKPFYTTKPDGHGMGTSISAAIVHLHGGNIKIKSRPGEGCKIKVSLPCREIEDMQDMQEDTFWDELSGMIEPE